MRILLANHHLVERAGSELYVSELATGLAARGHQVMVFAFEVGPAAERLRAQGVPVSTHWQREQLVAFAPELVHAHHGPTLAFLSELELGCPAIFSSLGVVPPHEAPPPDWSGVALGLAVSEEVRARLQEGPFGAAVPLELVRNWYDERGWAPSPAGRVEAVRTIAVVTNHLAPELAAALDALGLPWTHFGLPHRSREVTPETLAPFDLIITIGRTVLLAGAMGKPCLVADVHGSDGLLSADRVELLQRTNFSGRATRGALSKQLLAETLAQVPSVDLAAVQQLMHARFSLSTRLDEIEALHRRAAAADVRLDAAARRRSGAFGALYAHRFDVALHWLREFERVGAELRANRDARAVAEADHQRERTAQAEALRQVSAQADQLRQQVVALQHELQALALQRQVLTDEKDRLVSAVHALEARFLSDEAARVRRLGERVDAARAAALPEGSRRLAVLRRSLHALRSLRRR